MKAIDLEGKRFGRLLVIQRTTPHIHAGGKTSTRWICWCDCGNLAKIITSQLLRSITTSCGCYATERKRRAKKHGLCRSRVYTIWCGIIARCGDKNNACYGGRGIGYAKRWSDFEKFLKDMGHPPSDRHTIERRDNEKGYSKKNCCWALPIEQGRNKRNNRWLVAREKRQTISEWSRETGIKLSTLSARIKRGWYGEKVLTKTTK
jgi:hypothetical protein